MPWGQHGTSKSFSLEAMAQTRAKAGGGKGTSLNSGESCTQDITANYNRAAVLSKEGKGHTSQDDHTSSYHQVKTLLPRSYPHQESR